MADKVRFKVVKKWIPNLSQYRYNIARHHIFLYGRGSAVPLAENTRMKVSPAKLDHFLTFITSPYVMQDLPFGEKTLKLSSNTEIKIPNVVRTMIPERIVQQYQCYCHETGFVPMSRTTLFRVLKVCSASVRKSLQGLDYVSAEGAKAFDELADVIDKLGDNYGKGLSWAKDQSEKLKMAKRYLKGDFRVHVSPSSRVADHCRAYALSYPGDPDYASTCNHEHNLRCHRCDLFSKVVSEVESALANVSISTDEKDEMKYVVSLPKKTIEAWKAHLLRSISQDEARLDVLKNLEAH